MKGTSFPAARPKLQRQNESLTYVSALTHLGAWLISSPTISLPKQLSDRRDRFRRPMPESNTTHAIGRTLRPSEVQSLTDSSDHGAIRARSFRARRGSGSRATRELLWCGAGNVFWMMAAAQHPLPMTGPSTNCRHPGCAGVNASGNAGDCDTSASLV